MKLYERLLQRLQPLDATFNGGQLYSMLQSWSGSKGEHNLTDFVDYVQSAYMDNGVVFACVLARGLLLSEVEFQFMRRSTRELFGDPSLQSLEEPWTNGSTGELIARADQDVSLAGNFYVRKLSDGHLERLRPDWVTILTMPNADGAQVVAGYAYLADGPSGARQPQIFLPEEVAHWSPVPDPLARFRGLSWITPVAREILGDKAMSTHKLKFFDNAATPPVVIAMKDRMDKDAFEEFVDKLRMRHAGTENAYKAMVLNGGADVTLAGANMEQLAFSITQAAGENRICVASGAPAIVVGLKEGLQAATYSNYQQAMRRFGDLFGRPMWRSMCTAFRPLVVTPAGAKLWYDDRYVAALRDDAKDAATIRQMNAQTVRTLVDGGYTPESAVLAVTSGDMTLLKHTGLFSVQLQPAGQLAEPAPTSGST